MTVKGHLPGDQWWQTALPNNIKPSFELLSSFFKFSYELARAQYLSISIFCCGCFFFFEGQKIVTGNNNKTRLHSAMFIADNLLSVSCFFLITGKDLERMMITLHLNHYKHNSNQTEEFSL